MVKILLIDDSNLSRRLLKRALGEDNFAFLEASDAISGLELYSLEQPGLVILDLTMPGMTGMEMLARLRQLDPYARVLIVSADVQEYSRLQARSLGALDFINKPFDPVEVQMKVYGALHEA